jgi:transposase InsO family protein
MCRTIFNDDHSRAIAGFLFTFDSPSAAQTALVLRQAIWRKSEAHWVIFSIPEVLYTDNSSDFTSTHLEQVAVDIKNAADLLHARRRRCRPWAIGAAWWAHSVAGVGANSTIRTTIH